MAPAVHAKEEGKSAASAQKAAAQKPAAAASVKSANSKPQEKASAPKAAVKEDEDSGTDGGVDVEAKPVIPPRASALLGKAVAPVDFVAADGKRTSLSDLRGKNLTLVVMLSSECPMSMRYVPVLGKIAKEYQADGLSVIGVLCEEDATPERDKELKHLQSYFPSFVDGDLSVARHFQAEVTPQAFLLDKDMVLRYVGAVDDQYRARMARAREVQAPHLALAIEEVLAGEKVETPFTTALGCALSTEPRVAKEQATVTFHRDIEPILQEHCQRCHRPGEVGPFGLMSYESARKHADDIVEQTANREMPPWPITGGVRLKNDVSLRQATIDLLAKWVDDGCPKGDPADAPKPAVFHSADEWEGDRPPDLVLQLPSAVHLAATGDDHYRTVAFPLNNEKEKYVAKTQFIAGNRKIVHHALYFYDGTGLVLDAQNRLGPKQAEDPHLMDKGPGYESGMGLGFVPNPLKVHQNKDNPGAGLGGWVPGAGALVNPEGARHVIPPHSALFMQLHYQRTGKPEVDETSRIGIWFDEKTPEKFISGGLADTTFRFLSKGKAGIRSTGTKVVPVDGSLWLISPHMHMLGKEFRAWHQAKGSKKRTLLLELKHWNFDWQSRYVLEEPYPVKKGDKIYVEAVFDNSAANASNPNKPPKTVFLGENTKDEMGFAVLSWYGTNRPLPGSDFIAYFKRLVQSETLQKIVVRKEKPPKPPAKESKVRGILQKLRLLKPKPTPAAEDGAAPAPPESASPAAKVKS